MSRRKRKTPESAPVLDRNDYEELIRAMEKRAKEDREKTPAKPNPLKKWHEFPLNDNDWMYRVMSGRYT